MSPTGAPAAALGLLLIATAVGPARADFDPTTGRVVSDAAAFAYGFEGPAPGRGLIAWNIDDQPVDEADRFVTADAIEGDGAFLLGGPVSAVHLDAAALPAELVGRRVEIRIWARAEGTTVEARMWWGAGDLFDALSEGGDPRALMGELVLHPSGRATDDGWHELTSGPVDFALGGRLPPDVLSFYDAQWAMLGRDLAFGGRIDDTARVRLDGLEIVDLGPAAVPETACRLPTQGDDCGPHGVCLFGQCADGAAVFGPALPPPLRQAVADRRAFELHHFNGSRTVQTQADVIDGHIAAAAAADSAHRFWAALQAAYVESGDGHAMGPLPTVNVGAADVCAALGVADQLPDAPERPIVYRVGNGATIDLAVGDAIYAIDGLEPHAWLALTRPFQPVQGDPEAFAVDAGRTLLDLAQLAGAELEVHRCAADGGCDAAAVEVLRVDLAAGMAPMWDGQVVSRASSSLCDYRPDFLGANGIGAVIARDEDDVRRMVINGVPDSRRWRERTAEALDDGPELLVIDQRVGFGGQSTAVAHLLERLFPAGLSASYGSYPAIDTWDGTTAGEAFEACLAGLAEPSQLDCGAAEAVTMSGTDAVPAPRRIAILGGAVVSGNEYLARMLQARDGVRIFAPAPTTGGFGWVLDMPALVGEASGGRMQLVDTFFAHAGGTFGTGTGIAPDERVLYRQSDLLAGRDTVLEAALTWLRQAEEGQ